MNSGAEVLKAGTTLDGRYQIQEFLEWRANSAIYAAFDLSYERIVALNVLTESSMNNAAELRRHENEARCLARLGTQPNFLGVYEYAVSVCGKAYFACELIQGGWLLDVVGAQRGMPLDSAMPVIAQICDALQFAHDHEIVIREFNPTCIQLVARENKSVSVKISNISGAHGVLVPPVEPVLTLEGPCYLSPEIIRGTHVDFRTDIFSMGCLIYETLTGMVAFTVNDLKRALEEYSAVRPRRFEEVRPDLNLPRELEAVIRRSMERDPNDRYGSMREFKNAILFSFGSQSASNMDTLSAQINSLLSKDEPQW